MKLLLLLIFWTSALITNGQLKLKKGQQIAISSTIKGDVDMGMGMMMTNNFETESLVTVADEKENVYTLDAKVVKAKAAMDMMGQSTSYDSDKPADSTSEMGKLIGPNINKNVTYYLNKLTGTVAAKDTIQEKTEENPMASFFQMNNVKGVGGVAEAFLIITDARKKEGSWTNVDSAADVKTTSKYTIESLKGDDATIKYESTTTANSQMEQQGMQITVNMISKANGTIETNIKTNLVKRRTLDTDIAGTFEVMGQTQNITGKQNSVTIYTSK